ncbi:peptidoglycan bridge formation glycyltransferase FemA/FemB family protein [Candidatus Saccharibacteria bacterium]|nr:peptidoglycan bridge formation glycyltransferase FemA/FemB family protein [Candidatus Saccharibacteria bacterium]
MNLPITQSEAWYKLQKDLDEESILKIDGAYQYLAIQKHTPIGGYYYCPYGPVADNKTDFKKALDSLLKETKNKDSVFVRIEPQNTDFISLLPKNAVKTKDLNPKETWVLDLDGTSEELHQKFPSRLLRYYKNAKKKGITIETSHQPKDIKYLLDLQQALAKKKGINTFSAHYLETELKQPFATLYLVKYNNPETNQIEIVAAGLVFDDEKIRYNLQGAQSDIGRKLHATGILTIKLIEDAKEKGLSIFDFWGIAPERAPKDHPWAGFTNFKKTFSGRQIDYAGTYDIPLKPFKYRLYQLLRKINLKRRKI